MISQRGLKIGWRLFRKDIVNSSLLLFSLSLSFALCFLLFGYAQYSYGYDAHIPNAERIFLVKHRVNAFDRPIWVDFSPIKIADALERSGIPYRLAYFQNVPTSVAAKSRSVLQLNVANVSANFSQVFMLTAQSGSIEATLSQPGKIALTRKAAVRLFGTDQVLGQTVQAGTTSMIIGAVINDLPSNTTVNFDALTFSSEEQGRRYLELPTSVDENIVVDLLQQKMNESPMARFIDTKWLDGNSGTKQKATTMEVRLSSLRDAYFDRDLGNFEGLVRGDKRIVLALCVVGFLVFLISAFSFVNVGMARLVRRQKEVGVYKAIGVPRLQIISQFLAESLLWSSLSLGLGLLLAWMFFPLFVEISGRSLDTIFSLQHVLFAALFSLILGMLLSVYPIFLVLGVNANHALSGRGNSEGRSGARTRRALSILQFSAATVFGAIALAIAWQTFYTTRFAQGFSFENLWVINLQADYDETKYSGFIAELKGLRGVDSVAYSSVPVGRDFMGFQGQLRLDNEHKVAPVRHWVSQNFFEVHQIKPIAGRVFDSAIDAVENDRIIVLNDRAVRALGFDDANQAVGKFITPTLSGATVASQIIGVIPDVRFQNAHESEGPRVFTQSLSGPVFSIRIRGAEVATLAQIESLWRRYFNEQIFDPIKSAELIAQNHAEDIRLSKMILLSALLGLILAAIGVYVMAAYNVQRRAEEIAIRKIYGAGKQSITAMVLKEYAVLMIWSSVIAVPISAFCIWVYLSEFAERAPIGLWTIVIAILLTSLAALTAVVQQSTLAMKTSPLIVFRN